MKHLLTFYIFRFFAIKIIAIAFLSISLSSMAVAQSLTIDADHPATITDSSNPLNSITSVYFNNGVLHNQTTGTTTTTSNATWTLTGAGEFNINAGQTLTITGSSLSGSGNLTKTGDGELYVNLSGTFDTRTGTTTLSGGTFNVAVKNNNYNNQNLSATGQLIFDGGTLKFTRNGGYIFGLSHNITVTEGNAVKLDIGTSYVVPKGTSLANKAFDIIVSNSNNKIEQSLAFNSNVSNMTGYTGTITAEKYGRVTIEKKNVLTATTKLQVNSTSEIEIWENQTIDKVILNGGMLSSRNSDTQTVSPVLTVNSGIDVLSDSTIRTKGNTTTFTLTGKLSGTGNIEKTGAQRLILPGDSSASYTGKITITEGTLDLTGKVGGHVEVGSNAALRIAPSNNNFSEHILGTVSGSGILITTANLIVDNNAGAADLTGFSAIEIEKGRFSVTSNAKLGTQANPVAITVDSGAQYWGRNSETTSSDLHISSITVSGVGIENFGVIRNNVYNVPVILAADSTFNETTVTGNVNLQGFTLSTGKAIRQSSTSSIVTLQGNVIGDEGSAIFVTSTSTGTNEHNTTLNLSGDSKLEVPLLTIDNGDYTATVNLSKTQDSTVETLKGNGTLNITNGRLMVTQADDFIGALNISAGGTLALNGNTGSVDFLNIGSDGTLVLSENAIIGIDLDTQINSGNVAAIVIDDNATFTFPTEYSLQLDSVNFMSLLGQTINVLQKTSLPESVLDHLDFSHVGRAGIWNYGIANGNTLWVSLNPNAVPEPSSIFLMAIGLMFFVVLRNRRIKQ